MSEILIAYETTLNDEGKTWRAKACGRPLQENLWEGWIEFASDDGTVLGTGRETTQPNRDDLEYWASGVEAVYLEGAFERAKKISTAPPVVPEVVADRPAFDAPAPSPAGAQREHRAVLDPFKVQETQGEEILRQELHAMSDWQLRSIIEAHGLDREDDDLARKRPAELISLILARTGER